MKEGKNDSEGIIFTNDEDVESLFKKIIRWDIPSQVKFAVSFDNTKRNELFNKIVETTTDELVRQNVLLIAQRIDLAFFIDSEFTNSEIAHYQSWFAMRFYNHLHTADYQSWIEDEIRELRFYCNSKKLDLETKQYEFIEDREQEMGDYTEAERCRLYLEKLLIHLNNPSQLQIKIKTEQQKLKPFIAKEYALAYILDLKSDEKEIPTDPIDGEFAKKALEEIASQYNFPLKPDSFYREVKNLATYDTTNIKFLEGISKRWVDAVRQLSIDWKKTEKYLKGKGLIGE